MVVVHPPVAAPEELFDSDGADVEFPAFRAVITDERTTVAQLFAVLRLWEPMIQEHIGAVAFEMLRRGASVNDKDGLTDMTLLHFAAKSGARGLGDTGKAASVTRDLIKQGADVNAVCGWTQMTPLHYAAFFSSTSVLEVLAREGPNLDINAPCPELEGSTPLHMAAMTGSPDAVEMLLQYGSDPSAVDASGKTALDCALSVAAAPDNTTPEETWDRIKDLLRHALSSTSTSTASGRRKGGAGAGTTTSTRPPTTKGTTSSMSRSGPTATSTHGAGHPKSASTPTRSTTVSSGQTTPARSTSSVAASPRGGQVGSMLRIGDRVEANGKTGIIRFRGSTQFTRSGEWIGIQLDRPEGTHNGTVKDVEYFRCKPNHGVFVRPAAVRLIESGAANTMSQSRRASVAGGGGGGGSGGSTPSTPRRSSNLDGAGASGASGNNNDTTTTPRRSSASSRPGSAASTPRRSSASLATPSSGKKGFGVGSKVMVKGKMATVRYIGSIHVAEGKWLGVEFADQGVGKNDGSLDGERYFKTEPNRGSFVKPDQATWRGIKCSLQL